MSQTLVHPGPSAVAASLVQLPLDALEPHPANSNQMSDALFQKLVNHIKHSGRYPPLVVRPHPSQSASDGPKHYQILDGHHRVRALRELKAKDASAVVWDVDDQQALILLATLNRLQGQDAPLRRAALVAQLSEHHNLRKLAQRLPESKAQLEHLLRLNQPPPPPVPPHALDQMPVAVHFFLLPADRRQLENKLKRIGGSREQALMKLLEADC